MYTFYYNHTDKYYDSIYRYLEKHDNDFPIRLSEKVNLEEYLFKINKLGKSIICMNDKEEIIGLVFYYDNNIIEKKAFVSLVSIDKNYRNRGIAKNMILELFKCLKNTHINLCEVPTHKTNYIAINLYESLGFKKDYINENENIHLVKKIEEVD